MAKLKDTPKFDRPREKYIEKGPDALTDSELLAILLGNGTKGMNVKVVAQKIIKKFGTNLINVSVDELKEIKGIGQAKALQIVSVIALAKRLFDKQNAPDNLVLSAQDAVKLVIELKDKKQEHLVCLYLNARNALIKKEIVSIGTLDKSIVHPRDIFALGLELHAAGVILIHNHPSGDVRPSEQDKQVVKRIIEAGQLMGVNVVDFLIVAKNATHSVLGETSNTKLADIEYVAEGLQASLFSLLTETKQVYFYGNNLIDTSPTSSKSFRFIDLFAGIGGIRIAFERNGGQCVFTSEFDEPCQVMYEANFGDKPHGDIRKISADEIPDHDILTGGFPCQAFSIIGKKRGFADTRGTLFFDVERILKVKQPKAFLLENVKQLTSHDGGRTFKIIIESLKNLGYYVHYKVLNGLDFGVPQRRQRIMIVGFKENYPFEFPKSGSDNKTLADILEPDGKIDKKHYLSDSFRKKLQERLKEQGKKPAPQPSVWHENKGGNIGMHPYSCALRANGSYNYLTVNGERRLTPREMLRLQGFPDTFRVVVPDTQVRKQAGNSVVIPKIQAVARAMVEAMKQPARDESHKVGSLINKSEIIYA
jgi:DNA (cytosine-5)-methyltransferase 1